MNVFMVQRYETDPGGGTPYPKEEPWYVTAENVGVIKKHIEKFPKGFYRWEIKCLNIVPYLSIRPLHQT